MDKIKNITHTIWIKIRLVVLIELIGVLAYFVGIAKNEQELYGFTIVTVLGALFVWGAHHANCGCPDDVYTDPSYISMRDHTD